MTDATPVFVLWALVLGAISAVSLPLGSLVGLRIRFPPRYVAIFAAFGAGALIAALSVELVAPTALALTEHGPTGRHAHAEAHFFAMLIGGVLGGLLFVVLDGLVNSKGGYLRKTSTTLAYLANRRRAEAGKLIGLVRKVLPFDALPEALGETLVGMLKPIDFKRGDSVLGRDEASSRAYLILAGEADVEIAGRPGETFGPGALIGVLTLFVPEVTGLGTIKAKSDLRCLALAREDVERLRALSPEFDTACRELAAQRVGRLEQHLTARLAETVEWAHSAASALSIRPSEAAHKGSPLAVWLGILLDGIPESIVIGAGLFVLIAAHADPERLRFVHAIPYTLIAGLFLSNFPEALSSSANMLKVGLSRRRIFLMWFALMVTTAIGAALGFLLAGVLSESWLVFAEGLAAGAMLTMIAAAMIPEAAAHGRPNEVGLGVLIGFLVAVLFKLLE